MKNLNVWKRRSIVAASVPLALAAVPWTTGSGDAVLAASEQPGTTWTFHYEHVLGTSLELRVRARDLVAAQRAEAATLHEIDRQDALLSAWRSIS